MYNKQMYTNMEIYFVFILYDDREKMKLKLTNMKN